MFSVPPQQQICFLSPHNNYWEVKKYTKAVTGLLFHPEEGNGTECGYFKLFFHLTFS